MNLNLNSTSDTWSLASEGIQVNEIEISELFDLYRQTGFLYPEKERMLAPYLEQVAENWEAASKSGQNLMKLITFECGEHISSVVSWRKTPTSWVHQHLVSTGRGISGIPMLAANHHYINNSEHQASINYFRFANRYARAVFGSINDCLGNQCSVLVHYDYFMLSLENATKLKPNPYFSCRPLKPADSAEIRDMLSNHIGNIYMDGEEVLEDGVMFDQLKETYQKAGLLRDRSIQVCRSTESGKIVGIAIAERAPLGFNFSFLENAVSMIVPPELDAYEKLQIVAEMIKTIAPFYTDITTKQIPILIQKKNIPFFESLGAQKIREYAQCIWLKRENGFDKFQNHIAGICNRRSSSRQKSA